MRNLAKEEVICYRHRHKLMLLSLNTSQFSLERTKNFCSFQVTRFVVRNLFIKMKSYLLQVFRIRAWFLIVGIKWYTVYTPRGGGRVEWPLYALCTCGCALKMLSNKIWRENLFIQKVQNLDKHLGLIKYLRQTRLFLKLVCSQNHFVHNYLFFVGYSNAILNKFQQASIQSNSLKVQQCASPE